MSIASKGKLKKYDTWNKGKNRSEKTKKKISDSLKKYHKENKKVNK